MSNNEPIEYLTVNEAMEKAKVGRTKLYRLLSEGSLRARKSGARTLIETESLAAWSKTLPVATFKKAA
ncbi:helix-turn-helix domain-containing protein [Roseococcus sp.]|uniref:helix-turn-helix domain-containing protein n=1 Tax=Roseococcus sp. TaxID=2109646 RepID=UPI003BAA2B4E